MMQQSRQFMDLSLVPSGQNYTLAWNQNGNGAYLNGTISSNLFVNNLAVLSATATGNNRVLAYYW